MVFEAALGKLIMALLLQLTGLGIAVLFDRYFRGEQRRLMLLTTVLLLSLLAAELLQAVFESGPSFRWWRIAVSVYAYSVRPLILLLLITVIDSGYRHRLCWLLVAVNAAVYMTAFFSGLSFSINDSGGFVRGPLNWSCLAVSVILIAVLAVRTLKIFQELRGVEKLIPPAACCLILAAAAADMLSVASSPVSFLTVAMVTGCVFYYIWLHQQYARKHEQALVAEQQIQIMISQIQPHFLFNTLSTIQALCRIDPEKAFDTTEKFGTYLRMNIESLSQSVLIPFQKEMEHTKIYAEIEMIRFPAIRLIYDIRDDDFELPALSVQPMVENAIRHGLRGKYGGIVSVITFRDKTDHVVIIRDNGWGFDTKPAVNPKGSHIGIRNVRERIEKMCQGTMSIESIIGEGTTVTIRIPLETEKEKP